MDNVNLDPVVGEEVRWGYQPGVFRIVRVRYPGDEHPNPNLRTPLTGFCTADLQRAGNNFIHEGVPWGVLQYIDETRPIRRFLEWLKQDESFRYPQGITGFRVDSEERFDGEPQFVVRFLVESTAQPTRETVREWNDFTSWVREQILTLILDRWVQVMVQKEQETMHATL